MPARTRTKTPRASSRATHLPAQKQDGIQRFTKTVKPGAREQTGKGALSLKRKLGELEESESSPGALPEQKTPKLNKPETPSSTKWAPVSDLEGSPRPTASYSDSVDDTSYPIRPTSPEREPDHSQSPAFCDLVRLHSSFLGALSLHYTHNGYSAPANIKDLAPTIQRLWRKRKVVVEDIRRLLYVQENSPSTQSSLSLPQFEIYDYGTRYCIERLDPDPEMTAPSALPLNEAEFRERFYKNLVDIWQQGIKKSGSRDADYIPEIPLAPIHKSAFSRNTQNTARQQILDLRAGTIRLKAVDLKQKVKDDAATARGSSGVSSRQSGLLQRIQAKGLHQSTLPPPPSKETALRRSAADHIPEVVNVLLLLSPSTSPHGNLSPKKPFRLHTIVQNIQDSMRNPVSKHEVETCLDILSQETVASDWISIVTLNQLKSVVLKPGRNVSSREIVQRVSNLEL